MGLNEQQVSDLADVLKNARYDPAFVRFDPSSRTDTFQPNERDLTDSAERPDLAVLNADDGLMPSGLPQDNNDAFSRPDMGREFLDVSGRVQIERVNSTIEGQGQRQEDEYKLANNSSSGLDTHLLIVAWGLSPRRSGW